MATLLGETGRAEELTRQAQALRERFEQIFWCEELSTYALALNGPKNPRLVRTSNAGHCLFTEIASGPHSERTAYTLMSQDLFSGWGIQIIAAAEVSTAARVMSRS